MYTYYYFIVVRQWTSQFSMLVDVKEDEKRKLIITYIQPAAFERRERDKKTYINRKEVKKSLLLLQYKKTQAFKEKKTVKKQKAFSLKNDTLWKKLHLGSTSSSTLLLSLSKKRKSGEKKNRVIANHFGPITILFSNKTLQRLLPIPTTPSKIQESKKKIVLLHTTIQQ